MSGYDKRIGCLPILIGFPALGALCDAAGCGAAGASALCSNDLEATLAAWLTGRRCDPGLPISRDQAAVYMCGALLGGDQQVPVGPEVASFPNLPVEHPSLPCIECHGNLNSTHGCPHGRLTSSIELACGQMAVPIIGVLDRLR